MLDEYAARYKNIKVIHQPNSGVVAARKAAICAAAGEFCYFLDSDDWLPETAVSDLVTVLDDETDIVFGNQVVVRTNGEEERRLLPQLEWNGLAYMNESLRHTNGCIGGKMFRKCICNRFDIDCTMRLNEDLLMNIQAGSMARKVRRIDKINYFYNWEHEGSLSKSQSDKSFRSVLAANMHISELLHSTVEYSFILKDGYIAYLQKNIALAIGRSHFSEESFLVKEARAAVAVAPCKYFSLAKRFGALRLSIWLAPLSMEIPRIWRIAVVRIAIIMHRKR
jgi:glycosyltransferase involved in cell wall biosynthesis